VTESHEVDETIGYQLRRLRRRRGLTQEELADRANVSRDLVAKLEQGRRRTARITSLASFARALDVGLSALVQRDADDGDAAGFFGGTVVTIATPLRQTTVGRPLVAQEDVEAAMVLARFLDAANITTDLQPISATGELDVAPRRSSPSAGRSPHLSSGSSSPPTRYSRSVRMVMTAGASSSDHQARPMPRR
jgi:transcriptional regulator with XRE-family HTH domain